MVGYNIGLWLPTRTTLSPISIAAPGMWLEEVKSDFLAALKRRPEYNVIDGLDFRRAYIHNGDVFVGNMNLATLDVYFWFGELDRSQSSFHIDILEAIGQKTIVINSAPALRIVLDKLKTQLHLAQHQIAVPDFIAVSRDNIEQVAESIGKKPFILKPRLGAFGVGITRVASYDELVDIVDYSGFDTHFLEEFVECTPNDFIGINLIDGIIVSSYGKAPSKFRNWKICDRDRRGGEMVVKLPSPEQARIATEVYRAIGLDILGVDILRSPSGRNFVVDVNSFPGLYPVLNVESEFDLAELLVNLIGRKLDKARLVHQINSRDVASASRTGGH
jgi:glutathione synthase/RimK-type ligase-like ATP-grasp enzyme